MIQEVLQKENSEFFAPRSMRLEFLKNCSHTIPTLAEWLYNEWHLYDATLTKEKLMDSFHKRMNEKTLPISFVVLKETFPVGLISLKNRSDPEFSDFPAESVWMGSFQVVPNERNQGIGERLFKFVTKVAHHLGSRELYFYTSNPKNVPWYLKRGAQVLEKRSFRDSMITIFKMSCTE